MKLAFADEVAGVRVLDPACGSGNFLYVALKRLLDLEKEVITFAAASGVGGFFPRVGPEQLCGIEVNPYAHELAQVVVWIGYIQWLQDNGFGIPADPVLKRLETIERLDAVLGHDADGWPVEPAWPEADVIIGNPPFLGDKRMRSVLGDDHVDQLRRLYEGRVPAGADLVTYWFEKARAAIAEGRVRRAGLLATQGIRGGANRRVLERIKESGDIFYAQADRLWILDGAAVQVSMIGFDDGTEQRRLLNDYRADPAELALINARPVPTINANLTSSVDVTKARRLKENLDLSFIGTQKNGSFELTRETAESLLRKPLNPNGRPNSDVIRPWANGMDVVRRYRGFFIVDFGTDMTEQEAALYEAPFELVRELVAPYRALNHRAAYREKWWIHAEPRPGMRSRVAPLSRFIATPTLSKHRLFVWLAHPTLPDKQLVVFARQDDYFIGVLHSNVHEVWARATGTQLREAESGFRYTPPTTFETFPFPWPPGEEPAEDARVGAIGEAARELVRLREAWLDPPGASEAEVRGRTLTALYNARPTWLELAHRRLDEAVLAAYGWPNGLPDEDVLERLLGLNLGRAWV